MRILVLGAAGQVARAVIATAPAGHTLIAKTRQDVDITNEKSVASVVEESEADWVVNGAAYTAVDLAEQEVEQARMINDLAVGSLARATASVGARMLHLSTDFVFDGRANRSYRPSAATNPLSAYGKTKLAGEQQALTQGSNSIVLRTAWVHAASGRNFALTMLRLMTERDEVRVVCDQIGTPTWASSIARAIWGLVDGAAPAGIYHWTDLGVASWYDFAVAIQEEALERGMLSRAVPLIPIPTESYPTPAQRPAFSVLNTESARAVVSYRAQHWRHTLRMMLDELRAA